MISKSNYGDINVNVLINNFEATASFGSESFALDLPISLPSGGGELINFNVTNATFSREIFVKTREPIDILRLFSEDENEAAVSLDYGGTFDAYFPLAVGISGANINVDLMINDTNVFKPNPVVDYAVDLCEVSAAMMDLFESLKEKIVEAVRAPFGDKPVMFDIDRLTDPLESKVASLLANFTEGMNVTYSAEDCNSRRLGALDTIQETMSLARSIKEGLSFANTELSSAGIVLTADILPYFNSQSFSIGVDIVLKATIEQAAAEVIGVVSDYISFSTDPSEESSESKLGLGYGDNAPVIDLGELASNAVLAAGLDLTFGIDLRLADIRNGIFTDYPLGTALRKGIALHIETWGAFAEIIVDPIELGVTLFERDIIIRDSHFAAAAEIRSRGKFVATIDDMITGSVDTAPLIPDLTVPLSAEFILDIPVADEIILSPIMAAQSDNLIGGDFGFDFDVDISTFLNEELMGNNTLTHVLQTATAFLHEVESLELELNASEIPSSLHGFFDIVNQLNDFGEELIQYISLVEQGMHSHVFSFFMPASPIRV